MVAAIAVETAGRHHVVAAATADRLVPEAVAVAVDVRMAAAVAVTPVVLLVQQHRRAAVALGVEALVTPMEILETMTWINKI